MSQYKPGTRLASAVCATEIMVIAAPDRDIDITCGAAPMLAEGEEAPAGASLDASAATGSQLGKRYTNEAADVELLCVKPGEGGLAVDGEALQLKGAKPFPSSD